MRGLFVTGTDTGAGKTVLAGAIVAALRRHGIAVRALKPVITGLEDPPDPDWPPDHELLARAGGAAPADVMVVGYGPAVSPHLAGELSGRSVERQDLLAAILAEDDGDAALVVEGVGGLLVPLCDGYDVRGLASDLGLPLVIAARAGLGTINHTLLTIEAARAAGLDVAAVVLTPWPASPGAIERSNRSTIRRLGGVEVWTLPHIARGTPELLAAAGAGLPVSAWIGSAAAVT